MAFIIYVTSSAIAVVLYRSILETPAIKGKTATRLIDQMLLPMEIPLSISIMRKNLGFDYSNVLYGDKIENLNVGDQQTIFIMTN